MFINRISHISVVKYFPYGQDEMPLRSMTQLIQDITQQMVPIIPLYLCFKQTS